MYHHTTRKLTIIFQELGYKSKSLYWENKNYSAETNDAHSVRFHFLTMVEHGEYHTLYRSNIATHFGSYTARLST